MLVFGIVTVGTEINHGRPQATTAGLPRDGAPPEYKVIIIGHDRSASVRG